MSRFFGIRGKLIVYSLAIVVFASVAISFYHYTAQSEQTRRQFTAKGRAMAASLALGIADWMYQARVDYMRKLLYAAQGDPDVVYTYAIDAEGLIFTDASVENPHRNQPFFQPEWLRLAAASNDPLVITEGTLLHILQPVILPDGSRIGYAYLGFSLAAADRMITENLINTVQVTLVVLVISGLLALALGRSFSTPVKQMVEAAHAFRAGRLDTRLDLDSTDELGHLGKAMNEMAAARQEAEERLRQAATVFDSTREGILITDPESRITAVNRAFSDITGYTEAEVLDKTPRILKSGRHDESFYQAMWKSLEVSGSWQGEIWNRRKNGELYPQWGTINSVRNAEGRLTHYIAVFFDISQIKQAEEKLQHLAHHDSLTGLPNRLLLSARLEHAMDRADREGSRVAVLFVDLDRFKHINDSLGHTMGDALLQETAKRLKEWVRRDDTIARPGGDEFTVVLESIKDNEDAAQVAKKLIQILVEPFHIEGHELVTSASIGIALYPRDGSGVESLLANADAAMYRAKEEGGGTYRFYTEELTAQATERVLLESQLRRAINRDELLLHYQPQVELASGRVIGMEALVRWQHPEQGMISPARFIPIAEETGLIIPLGEWVLRHACAQARAWLDTGVTFGRVSVNVSGRQVQRRDLAETVLRVLDETGLPPARLEIEITEGFIMSQAESAAGLLETLRGAGVGIAIDDFGTGYSSLAYLKRLPIDKLKIDQSFVRDLPDDENDAAIARAIIALGHSLELTVIAEGVETEAQRDLLLAEGCEQAQGYLYSRPLTAEALVTWIQDRT